jgi:uncharacterized membrane protein YqgA involved in biofilm formation
MLGTYLNAAAILLGAVLGIVSKRDVPGRRQHQIKVLLGVGTALFGFQLLWKGLSTGTVSFFCYQFVIVVVAMIIGHALGKLARIQVLMNRIGHAAKVRLENAGANRSNAAGDGFIAATLLFCAAPLGIVGAFVDGLSDFFPPLAVKALMDGLAAFSFARLFGWTAALVAIPVAAFLSGLSLLGQLAAPFLTQHGLTGVVLGTAGLLITYVTLIIFEVKKVELGNYLPCLIVAPALMKISMALFG